MISTRGKRIGGYAHWTNGDIGMPNIERDSITCIHCNQVVIVEPLKPLDEQTGWCMSCMKFICKDCIGKPCVPLEKWLEKVERATR